MARGRNQNRGRNQQLQNTQLKNFPLNQQQPQHPQLLAQSVHVSVHKQLNIKATNNSITTTTNETCNALENAPVANINNNSCTGEKTTNSPSIISESYGHINKINSNNNHTTENENKIAKSNNNNDANYLEAHADVEDLNTHLETYADPAVSSTTMPTNITYRMTMSNNSCENFCQDKTNGDTDSPNEDHNNDDNVSLCGDYNYSANESVQRGENEKMLNNDNREEYGESETIINCSPVIEKNGSVVASLAESSSASNKRLTATHNGNLTNGKFNELTGCDGDHSLLENRHQRDIGSPDAAMGQKNTKGDNTNISSNSKSNSPTPTPPARVRPFRDSSQHEGYGGNFINEKRGQSPGICVPTITVVDCSSSVGTKQIANTQRNDGNNVDKEEFYDSEIETPQQWQQQREFSDQYNANKEQNYFAPADLVNATQNVNSFSGRQRTPSPTSMYSRYNYMKLEDVEEEDEDADDDEEEEEEDDEDEQEHADELNAREQQYVFNSNNNLDNEYRENKNTNSFSPERQKLLQRQHQQQQQQHQDQQLNINCTGINVSNSNSNNNSDCNLSTSFPDSGMGESLTSTNSRYTNISNNDIDIDDVGGSKMKLQYLQQQQHQREQDPNQQQQQYTPFVRDGYSTDCDETLMQCDELLLDFIDTHDYLDPTSSQRLVCIESISLPDVVVESTNANNATSTNNINNSAATTSLPTSSSCLANSGVDRSYVNINGATGSTLNSVHFIPIHVEGGNSSNNNGGSNGGGSGRSSPRKQSVDDSLVGSSRATIEIIEDATELQHSPSSTGSTKNNSDVIAEKLKNDLLEQKTQFNVQLENAHKNVNSLQTKISEMQIKIEKLEQELSAKTWNVERLQGELNAAHKDDEYVRKKLKLLEDEKTNLRHRFSENEDELKRKCDELETQYNELQEKYKQTQSLASSLHTQLAKAQTETEEWKEEMDKIRSELEEQIRILRNALENSENERKICEDKWQREFEMLRTHNMEREESIMTDCEWQLRQMQKQCKDKFDKAENGRQEATKKVIELEEELEKRRKQIDDLKVYEAQMTSLRGVVNEQEICIQNLVSQIEQLKSDLAIANESLAEQVEAVKKIKYHCDNALYDKERQMIYRIDEVRNEAASFWEDKLYTEMTRLKNELESVYIDERREALDKLQAEHIEELKALTNRYSDNEEELRMELEETQKLLEQKSEDFIALREKSDNALLQTRMHLDRADREFQKAMCQEEERRETLETSLREEFQLEKEQMEAKFRERLSQIKDEFSKELQNNSLELEEEHTREIEKLKAKMQVEKDEALHALSEKHRKKLADVDEKIKGIEQRHKNDLKDLKAAYDAEKVALDKRDISNANEIEQLHRKCRCLTNLFEEMRMRYERRDPRQEDLREIAELRARCESQERDLYLLTDRLREMQIQMNELQQNNAECNVMNNRNNKKSKQIKKPPPKTMPTNCDVIYEENEERESPPPTQNSLYAHKQHKHNNGNYNTNNGDNGDHDNYNDDDDDRDDDDDDDDSNDHENKNGENNGQYNDEENTGDRVINHDDDVKEQKKAKTNLSSFERKNVKLLIKDNEDDSHMITAV